MNSNAPTPQQQRAIAARGNVLVVAGAGAGKTQTVVDRCLAWLLDPKNDASVDEILMVTFTNAAAAEMRQRLREGLEKAGSPSARLAESLALLDTAHISTLHGFCLHLISRNFSELGLDPRARVLPEERIRVMERETLDKVLERVYSSESESAVAIQRLVQAQGGDWDKPVRDLILRLHHYTQTLRDPAGWLARQTALFNQTEPAVWQGWLMEALTDWRQAWLPILRAQPAQNNNAAQCLRALAALTEQPARQQWTEALRSILAADANWPRPQGPWRDPIQNIFDEAEFLFSVCAVDKTDPLAEDWQWTRPAMLALLDAAGQFDRAFQEAKRKEGGLDYHDLEQLALRLLWQDGQPSAIACRWRERFRLIFVDEFQDINEAQEAIIQALGREEAGANRFLVGDVKQSIYGFRLADPRIFSRYQEQWAGARTGQVIPLTENFRSHESILQFINAFFDGLMSRETGGVDYDDQARLRFGNAAGRAHLAANSAAAPPVELHLRARGQNNNGDNDENDHEEVEGEALESASEAEKEARMVGRRLLELKNQPDLLRDGEGRPRPALWSDMVILLRSPRHKVEAYAKEFHRLRIPLVAARGGFYESLEARDLLGLLQVLDNPLQDLPLLGVLHSPLVGLTAEELAAIRVGRGQKRFWWALRQWHETAESRGPAYEKVNEFLRDYESWRRRSRHDAVSHCLEFIIDSTHYADWVGARERGQQRKANVDRLLQLARQFDAYDGESLYRFLRFVEAQQEGDAPAEPAAPPSSDAVRLLSIHQSKGLEFPIVAVADLGKDFNLADLNARIILDEEYGLSPQIQPPASPRFYPSLPWWLARRQQRRKSLGEEMRLLYVALTRASQRLILCGTALKSRLETKWPQQAGRALDAAQILSAKSYLDWLGPWLLHRAGPEALSGSGRDALLTWTLHEDDSIPMNAPAEILTATKDLDLSHEQRTRLRWKYAFPGETGQPAKMSVTALRRQITSEEGDESFPLFASASARGKLGAAETGLAHHTFLQQVSPDQLQSVAALRAEAARMVKQNLLTREEADALDFDGLAAFWQSDPGRQLLAQTVHWVRELPFTARFSAAELNSLGAGDFAGVGADEWVVVQGAIDLAAILPNEIWVIDFKTDHFPEAGLAEKVRVYTPQLALYARALERIHQRPVTKCWLHFLAARRTVAVTPA